MESLFEKVDPRHQERAVAVVVDSAAVDGHRICCLFTIRLLITWLTADSTNRLKIGSPSR